MVAEDKTRVLVIGGTGQQGRAVVQRLHERTDYRVSVLTRTPRSDAARALSQLGITILKGDMLDRSSIEWALETIDRAFFVTDYPSGGDPATEIEQGTNVVDAAVAQELEFLVYSSTVDATIAREVPHFRAKAAVESKLHGADVASAVLRPAPFYQNLTEFAKPVRAGFLPFPIDRTTRLPMVDVSDIGTAGARVLGAPGTYEDTVQQVVAQRYTLAELAGHIGSVYGTKITPVPLPLSVVRKVEDRAVADMFAWFRTYGQFRGSPRLRLDVDYNPFEEFVRSTPEFEPAGVSRLFATLTAPVRPTSPSHQRE